jgi:hypothetical protein
VSTAVRPSSRWKFLRLSLPTEILACLLPYDLSIHIHTFTRTTHNVYARNTLTFITRHIAHTHALTCITASTTPITPSLLDHSTQSHLAPSTADSTRARSLSPTITALPRLSSHTRECAGQDLETFIHLPPSSTHPETLRRLSSSCGIAQSAQRVSAGQTLITDISHHRDRRIQPLVSTQFWTLLLPLLPDSIAPVLRT